MLPETQSGRMNAIPDKAEIRIREGNPAHEALALSGFRLSLYILVCLVVNSQCSQSYQTRGAIEFLQPPRNGLLLYV